MLNQIGILSDNFFKFLTSLSLIICLYCASFDIIIARPHNELMNERNMQLAKFSAENGYLQGLSLDLTELVEDSIKNGNDTYWYTGIEDTSLKIAYYSTLYLDNATKKIVDSLNIVNRKLAEVNFQLTSVETAIHGAEHAIEYQWWTTWVMEIISFLVFIFGLIKWYQFRKIIDKSTQ